MNHNLMTIKFYEDVGCGACVRMKRKLLDIISTNEFKSKFIIQFKSISSPTYITHAYEDMVGDVPTIIFPTGRRTVGIVKTEEIKLNLRKSLSNEKK